MCFSSVCFCYHGYSVLPWSTLYRVNAKWSYLLLYSIALRTALLSSFNMRMTKFNSSRGNVCISLHLLVIYIQYPLLPGTHCYPAPNPQGCSKYLGALWRLLYRVDNLPSIFLSSMSRKRLLDNQGIWWSLCNHEFILFSTFVLMFWTKLITSNRIQVYGVSIYRKNFYMTLK